MNNNEETKQDHWAGSPETNPANKPSKDMMDMIKLHTDNTCDMVIDQCIKVVQDVEENKFIVSPFQRIIERLQNMKSK